MGSEILDSSGGARSVAPEQALTGPPTSTPLLELDELTPLVEPTPRVARPSRLRGFWRRLRDDSGARRTTFRTVILCLVIMAITASVVEFRSSRQAEAERNGRVAVDIRILEIRPADETTGGGTEGSAVAADVTVHNLGPADIEITALDVANGGDASDVVIANDVTGTSAPVEPGVSRETSYALRLPCRPSFQLGFGPPQLIARVRTADNAVHSVPVNLDAVNEQGGLLTACVNAFDNGPDAQVDYGSVSDGHSVTITIDVPTGPRTVTLDTPDVGVPVRFVTTPRLPTDVQPGKTLIVKITPTVSSCPRTPLDLDALQNMTISVGAQQISDVYLPALVAQAAGRACGRRG
jgi:hypothetical protein